jgi:hypothetical protein
MIIENLIEKQKVINFAFLEFIIQAGVKSFDQMQILLSDFRNKIDDEGNPDIPKYFIPLYLLSPTELQLEMAQKWFADITEQCHNIYKNSKS